eukprot:g14486.t1
MTEQQAVVADLLQALTEKDAKVLPNLKAALNSGYEELKEGVMDSADAGNTTVPLENAIQRILLVVSDRVAEKVFDLPVAAPTKAMNDYMKTFVPEFTEQFASWFVATLTIVVGGGGGKENKRAVVAVLKKLFEEADEKSVGAFEKLVFVRRGLETWASEMQQEQRQRIASEVSSLYKERLQRFKHLAQIHEKKVEAFLRELRKRFPRGNAAAINAAPEERRAAFFALVEEISGDFKIPRESANSRSPESPVEEATGWRGQAQVRLPEEEGQAQVRLPEEEGKLAAWVWVLIILGCVVLVAAIAGAIACCCCCRNTNAAAGRGPAAGGGRFSMDSDFSDSDLEI